MTKLKYTYFKDDKFFVGWFEDYPDYRTQGETLEELQENLKDIYYEITQGTVPGMRYTGELVVG